MSRFLKLQLNRACYVSLLEVNDIKSGIVEFRHYMKKLNLFMLNPFYLKKCLKEKKQAKDVFIEKIKKEAKKYFDEKKYQEALKIYKIIFDIDSKNIENIKNYVVALEKTEQFDLQLELAKYLVKIEKTAENYKLLSNAYGKVLDYNGAIKNYNKYFELSNKIKMDAADYNALGCYYYGKYNKNGENPLDAENAVKYMNKAVELQPSSKAYLKNAILAAMKAKDFEFEKKYWDVYLAHGYANKDEEFTYSASSMRNGDIKAWAKYYGSRFEKSSPAPYPELGKPIYTGKEDLSDKILMVHSEQGYGDNFLMWGYMPRLVKKAKKVIYYIQNNAYELIKDNDFGVEVYCKNITEEKNLNFDYHLPCMSIPIVLDLDKDTLSVDGGYIKPSVSLVEEYKNKFFNNDKFKIGIAFRGVASNAKRNIPLDKLALLDKLKNVQLYCFTRDISDKELKVFKKNKIVNIANYFENFAHTAAALECCDLIISSDNGVLNLAGAIGKKTFGVFNYHYEFRWYDLNENDCGWYKTVKPFVNDKHNNWDKTLKRVIEEVEIIKKNG